MSGTILAISSASAVLLDVGSLKSDISARKTNFNLTGATCATWSGDGDVFIGDSAGSVNKFDRKRVPVGTIYSGSEPVVALALRDSRSLVVAFGNCVHIVNTTNSKAIGHPIPAAGTIKAIAVSHDKGLLSITTESSVYVHDFSNNATVSLNHRTLPATFGVALFHPSRRSTLVVCCGSQLSVFDVNEPSSPLKVISLGPQSHVVDATFLLAKNMLAVALENRELCVVDLEKDKAIAKKLELKQSLRTIAVSADGSLLIIGTESGTVLVYDARTMGKPICSVPVGGSRPIIALACQKRSTPAGVAMASVKAASNAVGNRVPPLSDSNAQRVAPSTRTTRKASAETVLPFKDPKAKIKGVVNGNTTTPTNNRKPASRAASARSDAEIKSPTSTPVKVAAATRAGSGSPIATRPGARRVGSANTVCRISAGSSPGSSTRSTTAPSRKSDEQVPVLGQRAVHQVSPTSSRSTTERTPSPDLPTEGEVSIGYPVVYVAAPTESAAAEEADTTLGMGPVIAVDLSTPPKALPPAKVSGHVESRNVIVDKLTDTPPKDSHDSTGFLTPDGFHGTSTPPRRKMGKPDIAGRMQLSPMRSPVRLSVPASTEAHDFLRSVVRDAMLEREEEQRDELRALHLDMVKMGRAWKNELRSLMQEYIGDFQVVRLENERLRAENERLRRGY